MHASRLDKRPIAQNYWAPGANLYRHMMFLTRLVIEVLFPREIWDGEHHGNGSLQQQMRGSKLGNVRHEKNPPG